MMMNRLDNLSGMLEMRDHIANNDGCNASETKTGYITQCEIIILIIAIN